MVRHAKKILGAAVVAGAVAGAGAAASCQLVAGLDWSLSDAGAGPPGIDAAMEAGPPACGVTYPDPPGGTDDGVQVPPFVVALHSIDLGDNGDTPGYDLDFTCTCFEDAGNSCVGASPQLSTYCDADGGVDNQAAKLFQLIELPLGMGNFGSDYFSARANDGDWSLLIQVSGYNGEADDPSVEVAFFPSLGLGGVLPSWNGNDIWPVISTSVGDGGVSTPLFTANGAYVAGYTLVASVPTIQVTLSGGTSTITLQLSAGVVTGTLSNVNGVWSLREGVLAARWALADVFKSLSSYRDNDGNPICTNSGVSYTVAKSAICEDADILVDGTQPKSAPCDALSFAMGFQADPALLGHVADAGALTDGCAPDADPANDSCP